MPVQAQQQPQVQDSIVVKFGNNSQVVFLIRDERDYKKLQGMDLNQVAKDISMATLAESPNGTREEILIGEEGSLVYVVARMSEDGDKLYARLGNWEIEADAEWEEDEDRDDVENLKGVNLKFGDSLDGLRKEKTTRDFFIDLGISNWSGDVNPVTEANLVALGTGFGVSPNQEQVRPWGSWYVGLGHNNRTRIAGPLVLNYGGSFSFYNFKFEDRATRLMEVDNRMVFVQDNQIDPIKRKLAVSHINLFLVPMFDFRYGPKSKVEKDGVETTYYKRNKGALRIGAGPYIGHRLGGRLKYRFREDGPNRVKETKLSFLEDIRYGIRGQIGWRGVDLFVNYDMTELFKENTGVRLQPFSFGITL
jgi:hypothetical protein